MFHDLAEEGLALFSTISMYRIDVVHQIVGIYKRCMAYTKLRQVGLSYSQTDGGSVGTRGYTGKRETQSWKREGR